MPRLRPAALAGALLVASAAAAGAQTSPAPRPEPQPAAAAAPAGASAAREEHHGAAGSGWAELDRFHEAMAAAWHPAARGSDLAPARARMADLDARAAAWAKSPAPAAVSSACRAAATPAALAAYAGQVRGVSARARQGAGDAELKAALKGVHDRFHAFEAACVREEGEHGHH